MNDKKEEENFDFEKNNVKKINNCSGKNENFKIQKLKKKFIKRIIAKKPLRNNIKG